MQLKPVATATPDGAVIIRCFLSNFDLLEAEIAWDAHYTDLIEAVSENGIYAVRSRPHSSPQGIGLRKDALLKAGSEYRRVAYSIGGAVSEECSRSHELKKSRLRRARRR